jgi:hypothetical protein
MIVSPEWYFPFRLSNSDFVHIFHCPMHATYPTFHIHDIIIAIIFCEEYKLESFTLYSFFLFSCHFIPLKSKYLLSTLFLNTFRVCVRVCSFLNVKDQVSHTYKTTGKIIVMY